MVGMLLAACCAEAQMAQAAEITIFTSMGTVSGVRDLAAAFEQASGNKVIVVFRVGAALTEALRKNEPGDIVANFTPAFARLIKQGKVVEGSAVEFARAGVGVAVRAGAPKPDISTFDTFKRTMLAAKTIGYSKSGSGIIAARALAKVGIADQVKTKIRYIVGRPVAEYIANGDIDVGMQQINALLAVKGVTYVGPLPDGLQEYLYFSVGLLKVSRQAEAARAL